MKSEFIYKYISRNSEPCPLKSTFVCLFVCLYPDGAGGSYDQL
jgi:hypothetical protein